ncbi:MAG: NAD(P) transhydrogenase subunit alpha [Rickettsia sp.]|nr:NAD(P) transhydrogenase subunit alpha [Rickettsia sp.]
MSFLLNQSLYINMKIGFLKETYDNEKRIAITPETTALLKDAGHQIFLEQGAGFDAGFYDSDYLKAGSNILPSNIDIIDNADLICKISPSAKQNNIFPELVHGNKNKIILGMFSHFLHEEYIKIALKNEITLISLNLVPRISKLQNIDALSSQNNLIGYRAVIETCFESIGSFPMMMSAAGTVFPAKVLVLGTGVAGLQAIATAKRLGAMVWAYDVRYSTKEQVESLGAKFLHPGEIQDAENKSGYASDLGEDQHKVQEDFLFNNIGQFDVILTFAQIPNAKAPILITKKVFSAVKTNAVILDSATAYGGNVEFSQKDSVIYKNNIKIIGYSNLASRISHDSSSLYAKNILHFLKFFVKNNEIDLQNDLVKQICVKQ